MKRLLLVAAAIALCACASPCPKHDGSIEGYCQGGTAVNCRNDCADCTDYWLQSTCTAGCTVDTKEPSGMPSGRPALTRPSRYAVCGEWAGGSDGGPR